MISQYILTLGIYVGLHIIMSLGLNFVFGYAGQPQLGYAALYGIGAYGSAILATRFGLSFWLAFPLSVILAMIIGLILALPSLRLKEDFFCIATIGINFVVVGVLLYLPFWGGAFGIENIPRPIVFGHSLSSAEYLALVFAAMIVCIEVHRRFANSWAGLCCRAMKEDDLAASVSGIDVTRFKMLAFLMSAAYAGIAGSLYAHFVRFIHPNDFGFGQSILILVMVVLGGSGTTSGPILGATLLVLLPEFLRPFSEYRVMIYGLMLTILMLFQPNGLLGTDSYFAHKLSTLRKKIFVKSP